MPRGISIKWQSNFIQITLRHGCSPVYLLHIFRIPFLKNTCGPLLLIVVGISELVTLLKMNFMASIYHEFCTILRLHLGCFTIFQNISGWLFLSLLIFEIFEKKNLQKFSSWRKSPWLNHHSWEFLGFVVFSLIS